MQKFDVQMALEKVAEARHAWGAASGRFNEDVQYVMGRLLHEAAANRMSVEDVAHYSGLAKARVRTMMKHHGLDPYSSKSLLQDKAAKALAKNAELLGISVHEMDLMSPLAYLPMGSELRKFLETKPQRGVKELPEDSWLARAFDPKRSRGGIRFHIRGEAYEARLASLGGDPEQWGYSLDDLSLLAQADEVGA